MRKTTVIFAAGKGDAELTAMIADGGPAKKPAHAFRTKGLEDDQIKALVTYIRSLKQP